MSEEIKEEEILGKTESGVPTGASHTPNKREEMTNMDDLGGNNRYLDLKIGTTIELITAKIEKVQDDKYCLSNSQNADGKAYKVEITDLDGQILSVTAWDLWNKIRFAFKDLNILTPVTLKVMHPAHSAYEVEYMKDGNWVKVVLPKK